MLQQILQDMYIDPDVLDALNEDQKKTLFLKMRQEQVRRWKEREEKLDKDDKVDSSKPKPKKANRKNVSWLLGCDGDVAVIAISEGDEMKAPQIINSGLGERKAASLHNNACPQTPTAILKSISVNITKTTPESVRTGRENLPPKTDPGIQLNLMENSAEVRTLPPLQVSVNEHPTSPAVEKQQPEVKKDPEVVSAGVGKPAPSSPARYRPHLRASPAVVWSDPVDLRQNTPTPAVPSNSSEPKAALASSVPTTLHPREPQDPSPPESHGLREVRLATASRRTLSEDPSPVEGVATCAGRGRVAQLMKTFSVQSSAPVPQTPPPRGNKPPLPNKPSHLRMVATPSVR